VDFHPLLFAPEAGQGPFTVRVGFYDAGTGARVPVHAAEKVLGDAIVVTQLTLE
jgi:hypothetical protein